MLNKNVSREQMTSWLPTIASREGLNKQQKIVVRNVSRAEVIYFKIRVLGHTDTFFFFFFKEKAASKFKQKLQAMSLRGD